METGQNRFLESYIETALWAETDGDGIPLDNFKYVDAEIAPETRIKMLEDCTEFCRRGHELFPEYFSGRQALTTAHDFWLTRNRHGAGFWDGDYPKLVGDKLTELAHSFGEFYLYVGDDGRIYGN